MTLGLCFYILMLIWLVWGGYTNRAGGPSVWGGALLEFVLFLLLGWATFGAPLHG